MTSMKQEMEANSRQTCGDPWSKGLGPSAWTMGQHFWGDSVCLTLSQCWVWLPGDVLITGFSSLHAGFDDLQLVPNLWVDYVKGTLRISCPQHFSCNWWALLCMLSLSWAGRGVMKWLFLNLSFILDFLEFAFSHNEELSLLIQGQLQPLPQRV